MIKFKDLIDGINHHRLESPSVSVELKNKTTSIFIRFSSVDIVLDASYLGKIDPWLGMLCEFAKGKTLAFLSNVCSRDLQRAFQDDQLMLDFFTEHQNDILNEALELLKAALNKYQGRDYLYNQSSPLVCRCFGVREADILNYFRDSHQSSLDELASKTKAGMGCRSCVPQLKKWVISNTKAASHYYKEKSRADWLIEMDYLLSCFPESELWKMELESFQGQEVVISFDIEVSQTTVEEISLKLQDFLAAGLDADLSFFLIRARHRSKA